MRLVVAVLVKNGKVIGYGTNDHSPCLREGYATSEGYELCVGCDYPSHAEQRAIRDALRRDSAPAGAVLHLLGHYYVCGPCLRACEEAGVHYAKQRLTSQAKDV